MLDHVSIHATSHDERSDGRVICNKDDNYLCESKVVQYFCSTFYFFGAYAT